MDQPTHKATSDVEMESEDEEAAMAAAMGFSGFGKAPATKKRKYNSKTDAFIDGQGLQDIDKGGRKGQGSGGNEVPLGRMRELGAPSAQQELSEGREGNNEEIDLDMEEGDNDEDRPMEERCLDTSRPSPADEKVRNDARRMERRGQPMVNEDEIMLDDDEDDEASAPAVVPTAAAREAQGKIDAIVAAAGAHPLSPSLPATTNAPAPTTATEPKPKQKQRQKPKQAQGLAAFMSALQTPVMPPPSIPPPPGTTSAAATTIPPAPGTATTTHTYTTAPPSLLPHMPPQSAPASSYAPSSAGSASARGTAGARGQRNELWYVDYYDPSFNENPWKQLEQERGLPAIGSWLERPPRNRAHGSSKA